MSSILVVDGDHERRTALVPSFVSAGYQADACSPSAALERTNVAPANLVVLDWDPPGRPGLGLLHTLRRASPGNAPSIIVLSTRPDDEHAVLALDAGADDYIPKPYSLRELIARARSLLRRRLPAEGRTAMSIAGIAVRPEALEASVAGRTIALSAIEFRLLCVLMENAGSVMSRKRIVERVWAAREKVGERAIDVYVRRLRLALGPAAHGRHIVTVLGEGYCLRAEPGR